MHFSLSVKIEDLDRIASVLEKLLAELKTDSSPQVKGSGIVIIVKDTQPDVKYSLKDLAVQDAEGHPIPDAKINIEVTSTDSDVLEVTEDEDPATGTVHFGDPGVATVNAVVTVNGEVLASYAQSFTVTEGDPAKITGGVLSFEGLTDVTTPTAPPDGTAAPTA